MKLAGLIFAVLASTSAIASTAPKLVCEMTESPGNYLEYDVASKKIELVWNMPSHDGSVKTWREPLVSDTTASGYPYNFSACQVSQNPLRFEYACGNFTQGKLEVADVGLFVAKTWINGGYTERKIQLKNCR